MQIFIKTLTGRTTQLEVDPTDSILDVKYSFENETGVEAERQRLIFAGKALEDRRTLADYGIGRETTIHMVLRQAASNGTGDMSALDPFYPKPTGNVGDIRSNGILSVKIIRDVQEQDQDGSSSDETIQIPYPLNIKTQTTSFFGSEIAKASKIPLSRQLLSFRGTPIPVVADGEALLPSIASFVESNPGFGPNCTVLLQDKASAATLSLLKESRVRAAIVVKDPNLICSSEQGQRSSEEESSFTVALPGDQSIRVFTKTQDAASLAAELYVTHSTKEKDDLERKTSHYVRACHYDRSVAADVPPTEIPSSAPNGHHQIGFFPPFPRKLNQSSEFSVHVRRQT